MVKKIACFFIHAISIPFSHSIFVQLNWTLYLRDTFSIKTVKNLNVKILANLCVNLLNHTNVPRIWHLLKMQIYLLSSASGNGFLSSCIFGPAVIECFFFGTCLQCFFVLSKSVRSWWHHNLYKDVGPPFRAAYKWIYSLSLKAD